MNEKVLTYVVSRWNEPTETFVRREVAAAVRAGEHVRVVTLKAPGEPDGIVDEKQIEVIHLTRWQLLVGGIGAMLRRPGASVAGLYAIIRRGRGGTWLPHLFAWLTAQAVVGRVRQTSLFLAHFAWVAATAADHLARLTGCPHAVFVHAHDIYETRCVDGHLTDRLQRALVVFVESETIAADVRRLHGVAPVVMRMGVPEDFVRSAPRSEDMAGGAMVLSVGSLREKKGHDTLVRAVAGVRQAHLTIAGDGPQRADLEALIEELGVTARVDLLGHCDLGRVAELLDSATVFCLASRPAASGDRDGVPNVLIEAMARGVAVVATSVSGIPDLVEGAGLLVPPDDPHALAEAIEQVIDSPHRRRSFAEAGLERVKASYTTEANWRRMRSLIDARLASVAAEGLR